MKKSKKNTVKEIVATAAEELNNVQVVAEATETIEVPVLTVEVAKLALAAAKKAAKLAAKETVAKATKHAKVAKAAAKNTVEKVRSLGDQLIAKMRRGVVEFTYLNAQGKEIHTKGTLIRSKVPTNRKVAGAVKPKTPEMVVFYDVLHGVHRQFNRNQVISIAA